MTIFRFSQAWLLMIFNDMITYLISRYAATLAWDKQRLGMTILQGYASAVVQVTGRLRIWDFVDETV